MSIHRALVPCVTFVLILLASLFAGPGWVPVAEAQIVVEFQPLDKDFEDGTVEPLELWGEPSPYLTMEDAINGDYSVVAFAVEECPPDGCLSHWDETRDTDPPGESFRSTAGSYDLSAVYPDPATSFALVRWANYPDDTVAAVRLRYLNGVTEISAELGSPQIRTAWHPLPDVATSAPIRLDLSWIPSPIGVGGRLRLDLWELDWRPILSIDLASAGHTLRKVDRVEIGFRQIQGGEIHGALVVDDLVFRDSPQQ